MVRGTAVAADLARQRPATVPVTHYYGIDKVCRDCGRRFFFAAEQEHMYEELGFPLEADAVRCPPCRKRRRGIARMRQRYEELFHLLTRTADESLDMAERCLVLIEESIFHPRQTERVRMLPSSVPEERRSEEHFLDPSARVRAAEKKGEPCAGPNERERGQAP